MAFLTLSIICDFDSCQPRSARAAGVKDGVYPRMVIQRDKDLLSSIAEMVRQNSALYPRPIPLSLLATSPFELTQREIQACLQEMKDQEPYKDIAQTTTSLGSVFLYSTRHLDGDYASMLAEWLDVGQFDNP